MIECLCIISYLLLDCFAPSAFAKASADKSGLAMTDKEGRVIRVCVLKDADSVRLTLDGGYKIYSRKNRLVKEGKSLYKVKVVPALNGLLLGKTPLNTTAIKIKPARDGTIYVDKWRLRGEAVIFKTADSKLLLVNRLDVESYLYGVLYHEVSHRWPYEALKAQAIAARTYALYQKRIMKAQDYDVTADIYSQVYGGRTSEKYRTNRAVNLTKGKVLTYKGESFPAYYHATCGGFTEGAGNLWKIDIAPLKGVECKFCRGSKHFNWKRKLKLVSIETMLRKAGYNVGNITSIKSETRSRSNRIIRLLIDSDKGRLGIDGKDFRFAIGPNLVKSNNYEVELHGDTAVFKGIGWGHGVGMCQWGAYFMARKGYKADAILRYYYPGAVIQ